MKKILSITLILLVCISCVKKTADTAEQNASDSLAIRHVVVVGQCMPDILDEGAVITLEYTQDEHKIVDTTTLQNGCYSFDIEGKLPAIAILHLVKNDKITICLEPDTVKLVNNYTDGYGFSAKISGTRQNEVLSAYYAKHEEYFLQPAEMSKEEKAQQTDQYLETLMAIVNSNCGSLAAHWIFSQIAHDLNPEQQFAYLDALSEEQLKQDPSMEELREVLLAQRATIEGCVYTDFEVGSLVGESVHLSDLVGKTDYVLVDFWASWCGPCCRLLPHLKELYSTYHPTGKLEIIGVSIDKDEDSWKAAIDKYGLNWVLCRLTDEEKRADSLYGVKFIPTTILIDKSGIIVGRNLDPDLLKEIIKGK